MSAVQSITAAKGYATDIQAVCGVDGDCLAASALPVAVVQDTNCTVDLSPEDFTSRTLNIIIKIHFSGTGSAAQARQAVSDFYSAVSVDSTLGGKARNLYPVSDSIVIEQGETIKSIAAISMAAEYETNLWED
ncbi:hypothetical protein [Limisalsivibrio acetivorans]|uniref:hypothetical protein n=1 Tax=Limisalsivibrio acetivorans TaxID=1304888 RepID=UPI0003FD629E|nr:hypothetical protein [Limisalsivibrio acetivorans]